MGWRDELDTDEIDTSDLPASSSGSFSSLLILISSLVFLACLCGLCFGDCGSGGTGKSAAKDAVLSVLKAPSTAQFADTEDYGNGRYVITVDAQNGFGAMIRTTFCVVLPGGDPNAPGETQVFECTDGSIFRH